MSLRVRYVVATSTITLATLGVAFAAVAVTVNQSQERQLDQALVREAREEAAEAAALGGDELAISARPGPAANDVGPLTKYAVIFTANAGVIDQTPSWRGEPPARRDLPEPGAPCFDLWSAEEHLRGVHVAVPRHPGVTLLLAAPRTDLDGDERFIAKAMATAFGIALLWTVVVALAVVRRLTHGHQRITEAARAVAAGDLSARVDLRRGDPEMVQLAADIDAMIERLGALLGLQQRFVANAAHELRSPLTTLYGELSHALRRTREASEYERAIREALESTTRLRRLAEELLSVARIGTPDDQPLAIAEIAEVCREAAAMVAAEAAAREVEVTLAGPAVGAPGRPHDLVRLVRNLLENAVRHAPRGSAVTLEWRETGGRVELCVRDAGPGVPEGAREQVFEPFFRGPSERAAGDGGAGLGLTIAREIARAHGGELALAAVDGPGACFVLTLPGAVARA